MSMSLASLVSGDQFSGKTKKWSYRLLFVFFAFICALGSDLLLWNHAVGINLAIVVAFYCSVLILLLAVTKNVRNPWALLLLIPVTALTTSAVLYTNALVHGWGLFALIILLFVFTLLITFHNTNKHRFSFLRLAFSRNIFLPLKKFERIVLDVIFLGKKDEHRSTFNKILVGVVISIPILLIFGSLFAAADAAFEQFVARFFIDTISPELFGRVIRVVLFGTALSILLYFVISRDHALHYKEKRVMKLDQVISGVVLVLVNALFLTFVIIQFKYLFGLGDFFLQSDLTYAEYARKGFFELAWVVFLAAILVLFTYRSHAHHKPKIFITVLLVFLATQIGVVAYSALKRMNLYQEQFGYTVLRLYVEWCIYFVMALTVFSIIALLARLRYRFFFYTGAVAFVFAFTIVSLVNVDHMIAKENIRRFVKNGRDLDLAYLTQLSPDMVPALRELFDSDTFSEAFALEERNLDSQKAQDFARLQKMYERFFEYYEQRDTWFEWHPVKRKLENFLITFDREI